MDVFFWIFTQSCEINHKKRVNIKKKLNAIKKKGDIVISMLLLNI
jgi:hypothetical protein